MVDPLRRLVERLLDADEVAYELGWSKSDKSVVHACGVSRNDIPDLVSIAVARIDGLWPPAIWRVPDGDDAYERLPILAWRCLADLPAEQAVEPLIDALARSYDPDDAPIGEDLPHVLAKIGAAAIQPLLDLMRAELPDVDARLLAVESLGYLALAHPETHSRIVRELTRWLVDARSHDREINAHAVWTLLDLQATQSAEVIERAFAVDRIDVGVVGTWAEVRRELGVTGLDLKMPKNPYGARAARDGSAPVVLPHASMPSSANSDARKQANGDQKGGDGPP
jgi:HEAT repeat protein